MKIRLIILTISTLLGCSPLPETLKNPPEPNLQVSDVRVTANPPKGQPVRWGGTLIEVQNEPDETTLHVLAYPLNYLGRPDLNEPNQGRFLIKSKNFLDPAVYTKNSKITVGGQFVQHTEHQVGQKPLKVPVISLQDLYVWPEYRQSYYPNCGYGSYYGGYMATADSAVFTGLPVITAMAADTIEQETQSAFWNENAAMNDQWRRFIFFPCRHWHGSSYSLP